MLRTDGGVETIVW